MKELDSRFFNRLFWVFFIVMGALIVLGVSSRAQFLDVLLGIMLIALGANKLEIEMRHNRLEAEKRDTDSRIRTIDSMIADTHSLASGTRGTHELRLHKLDGKRAEQERKIEQNYRDLVRKIFELENKMNVIAKAIRDAPELLEAKARSGRDRKSPRAVKAGSIRRKKG